MFRSYESQFPRLRPARIAIEHRGRFVAYDPEGEHTVSLAGRVRHDCDAQRPVVGDWVVLEGPSIVGILPRRTEFVRRSAGSDRPQRIAANIDTLFLVTAAVDDFSPRRLERYLVAVRESGAVPVVVITKSDLHADPPSRLRELGAIADGVEAHVVSNVTGAGLAALECYFADGQTIALVGSSGVGKSTLANRLLGDSRFTTRAVLDTGRGQHTTTHRELCIRPGGGLLLDTPGMREFGIWSSESSVQRAFDDLETLSRSCRFRDCAHEREPGCAVLAALASGVLDEERWTSFQKLRAEALALERRAEPRLQAEQRRLWRARSRAHRARDRLRGK